MFKRTCLLFALSFACAGFAAPPEPFDLFVDHVAAAMMSEDPMSATVSQYFSGAEQDAVDRRLSAQDRIGTPFDSAARERRVARTRADLATLKGYSRVALTPVQRVSAGMLEWKFEDILRSDAGLADHVYVFEQFGGVQISLVNFLSQTHPIRNARDAENYLVRLSQVAGVLDQGIATARSRAALGAVPPRFILQATIGGIDRLLQDPPEKNVLVTSLDQRVAKLASIPADRRSAWVAAAQRTVAESVLPAIGRVRALLAGQESVASDAAGFGERPNGEKAYAAALASNTTTEMTPEAVHQLGLREVTRIEAQMDAILKQLGYADGSVKDRYLQLNATLLPKLDPDPRPALVRRFTEIVRDAEKRSVALFDLRPRAPVEVRREPPFTENGAAAHYSMPAPDGSKPGIFWIPLGTIAPDVIWDGAGMKSVAYHEAVPGHHFQLTLQQELPDVPRFRQKRALGGFTSFTEGWALYAERLAAESGWYEGDPQGHLGQLNAELFRARRLVVDTGLHMMHWSQQQAIDYGIQASEVDRYAATPGQACAYKIGELRILAERAKAQAALGPKFSLKQFHNLLFRTGTVPLAVLTQAVDDWIARGGGA